MNDNQYFTQINEIDGEIASLKISLKKISDEVRRKEIEEEIKALEEQKERLKAIWQKKSRTNFKDTYKVDISTCNTDNSKYDDFYGPTGDGVYQEHDDI